MHALAQFHSHRGHMSNVVHMREEGGGGRLLASNVLCNGASACSFYANGKIAIGAIGVLIVSAQINHGSHALQAPLAEFICALYISSVVCTS